MYSVHCRVSCRKLSASVACVLVLEVDSPVQLAEGHISQDARVHPYCQDQGTERLQDYDSVVRYRRLCGVTDSAEQVKALKTEVSIAALVAG